MKTFNRKTLFDLPWTIRILATALLVLVCTTSAAWAETDSRTAAATAYLKRMQQEAGSPGVSAAVAVGGEIVFSGGVGMSDLEAGSPASGSVVHNVGSISKTLALAGLMQLVEEGLVDLDTEFQVYIPWFPAKEYPITVRQLLTHTSGFGHYADMQLDRFPKEFFYRNYETFEESTEYWRDLPLLFEPGTHWSYSSYALNLVQGIVEELTKKSFEGYLRHNVFEPAGMLATQFDVPSRIIPNRGRGYAKNDKTGQLENDPGENVSYKYAGGGMLSSDEDLVRFGHALNAGILLEAASLKELYRLQLKPGVGHTDAYIEAVRANNPDAHISSPSDWQGLVWRLGSDAYGRKFAHHSGRVKGTASHLRNYYEEDVVVAVHFNFNEGGKDVDDATEALAQLYLSPRETEN